MARTLRVHYPGAIYHVIARGNAKQDVFRDDADRRRFLSNTQEMVSAHGVRLYLLVLMPNHVHLLVETQHANISAFMQGLLTGYTGYFNRRHQTAGHLFQGRFRAKVVQGDEYLLRLSRYIHLNPVQREDVCTLPLCERVRRLRAYRWSTFPGYAGIAPRWDFVDDAPVLTMAAEWAGRAPEDGGVGLHDAYRRYVEAGMERSDEGFRQVYAASTLAIGGEEFTRRIAEQYDAMARKSRILEDVAFRRRAPRVDAGRVLQLVAEHFGLSGDEWRASRRETTARGVAAWLVRRYSGQPYRSIASGLGWSSGTAVGIQVKRVQRMMADDRQVAEDLAELERRIQAEQRHQDASPIGGAP